MTPRLNLLGSTRFGTLPALLGVISICAVAALSALSTLAGSAVVDGARPLDLSGVGSGELLWKTDRGFIPLPIAGLEVDLKVTGIMIHGRITQTFHNPTDETIEALYAFPLPDRAAVFSMEMQIGDRLIRSTIREREEARRTYAHAKAAGKKAALVEQQRPNLFTTAAANINPGEEVYVVLEYFEEVEIRRDGFGLRFPLTYTPRFAPPDGAPRAAVDPPAAAWTSVLPEARITVQLETGFKVKGVHSASHAIREHASPAGEGRITVRPEPGTVIADRDFLLTWEPERQDRPESTILIEERDDGRYALVLLIPPIPGSQAGLGLPTETLFIVDVSGSMAGPSIRQAREALLAALGRLRPDDRFNMLRFNQESEAFRPSFQQADPEAVDAARDWVLGLEANGGTMIYPALMRGVGLAGESRSSHAQRIVFLTDGAVGNEQEVLRAVHERLGDVRLHTIALGQAPNAYLMRKMARFGRGLCEFIPSTGDAKNRIAAFFERLDRPVLTDVELNWNGVALEQIQPQRLPDLYADEPLLVSARIDGDPAQGSVTVGGYSRSGWIEETARWAPGGHEAGIAFRWARTKVESVMDTLHDGADTEAVRSEVVELALTHNLVTRFTSLVAVEEFPSATGEARPARLAAALPMGGTDGPLRLRLAALLTLMGIVMTAATLRAR